VKNRTLTQISPWISSSLIGLVLFFNVQCGLVFILIPGMFTAGFQVAGSAGEAIVRGFGILFLMWNVPYGFALWNPKRNRTSLIEAILMQGIGFAGESLILAALPAGNGAAQGTILRFILFDGCGLAALLLAGWISRKD
jgi:hypothetical protein